MGGSRGRLISSADRLEAIQLVQAACAQGASKRKACELLGVSLRTLERWQHTPGPDKRQGAVRMVGNQLTDAEKTQMLATVNSQQYRDLPPCQIVPRLADEGIYIASESSFYRVLRQQKQLQHRLLSKAATRKKPTAYRATGPNQVWSWDITYLPSSVRGLYFYLYMVIDIYSRKVVGWSIHDTQTSAYAAQLIQEACKDERVNRHQLVLHSDNGSPMKGATMLAMLETLGVAASFSRPSVSDDNPFSEALFKTLKYHSSFPVSATFPCISAAREWVIRFVDTYNNQHLHSGLNFITPCQRHTGDDQAILEQRHQVYLQAQQKHPERWSGKTRRWQLPDAVLLNPHKKRQRVSTQEKSSALKKVAA